MDPTAYVWRSWTFTGNTGHAIWDYGISRQIKYAGLWSTYTTNENTYVLSSLLSFDNTPRDTSDLYTASVGHSEGAAAS